MVPDITTMPYSLEEFLKNVWMFLAHSESVNNGSVGGVTTSHIKTSGLFTISDTVLLIF